MPHEVVRAKMPGMEIVGVREEDLVYFKYLTFLDVAENYLTL
jgi:hypothetical protein